MSLPKIRLERCAGAEGGLWRLDASQARRLARSLRLYDGAAVEGLLEDGGRRILMRLERDKSGAFLREVSEESEAPDGPEITLLTGLLKADQFDALLRTASEVGVKLIQPLLCERSVPRIAEPELPKKMARWQKMLDEGTSVTGSPFTPKIARPARFGEVIWDALPEARFAAVISRESRPISSASGVWSEVAFAVGPEGDWSRAECESLLNRGFIPVTLGKRIMRASIAAVAGCAWFRLSSGRIAADD